MRKLFLMFLSLACFISPVYAIEYGGIGGYPANSGPESSSTNQWFIYTLNPGESVTDALIIENTSDEAVNIKLYPADYTASTDGGFALEQEVEPRDDVGAWVTLSASGVVVEARSQVSVPFTLTVPSDETLDVGDHMGGILIEKIDNTIDGDGGVRINLRVGVRIYVTISGDVVESVEINDFDFTADLEKRVGTVTTTLQNTGNIGEDVKVFTVIENVYPFFDKIWKDFPVSNERSLQVLRDDELVSNFEFNLPFISYVKASSKFEYTDKDGEIVTIESDPYYMWILPPVMWSIVTIVSLVGMFFFLGFILFLKVKSRKSHKYFY